MRHRPQLEIVDLDQLRRLIWNELGRVLSIEDSRLLDGSARNSKSKCGARPVARGVMSWKASGRSLDKKAEVMS